MNKNKDYMNFYSQLDSEKLKELQQFGDYNSRVKYYKSGFIEAFNKYPEDIQKDILLWGFSFLLDCVENADTINYSIELFTKIMIGVNIIIYSQITGNFQKKLAFSNLSLGTDLWDHAHTQAFISHLDGDNFIQEKWNVFIHYSTAIFSQFTYCAFTLTKHDHKELMRHRDYPEHLIYMIKEIINGYYTQFVCAARKYLEA